MTRAPNRISAGTEPQKVRDAATSFPPGVASRLRRLAVNEKTYTIYDVESGLTLTETALLDVIEKRDAYPRLVNELKRLMVEIPKQLGSDKPWTNAVLRELGER